MRGKRTPGQHVWRRWKKSRRRCGAAAVNLKPGAAVEKLNVRVVGGGSRLSSGRKRGGWLV